MSGSREGNISNLIFIKLPSINIMLQTFATRDTVEETYIAVKYHTPNSHNYMAKKFNSVTGITVCLGHH
jgi:hypothetical protein